MGREHSFWVYIMTNEHDRVLYIGVTNDLARPVAKHRLGKIPGFAAGYRCRKLIYHEHTSDVHAALSREKQLRKWSRAKKVKLIGDMNSRWCDLAYDILEE